MSAPATLYGTAHFHTYGIIVINIVIQIQRAVQYGDRPVVLSDEHFSAIHKVEPFELFHPLVHDGYGTAGGQMH